MNLNLGKSNVLDVTCYLSEREMHWLHGCRFCTAACVIRHKVSCDKLLIFLPTFP